MILYMRASGNVKYIVYEAARKKSDKLSIYMRRITLVGIIEIQDFVLASQYLRSLSLVHTFMDDDSLYSLSEILKINKFIKLIDFSYNYITCVGATYLANTFLSNTYIEKVFLCGNQIANNGAKALAASLKENESIQLFELSNNIVGEEGLISLSEAFSKSKSIISFELSRNNGVSTEVCAALQKAIDSNTNILFAAYNNISDGLKNKLGDRCNDVKSLINLWNSSIFRISDIYIFHKNKSRMKYIASGENLSCSFLDQELSAMPMERYFSQFLLFRHFCKNSRVPQEIFNSISNFILVIPEHVKLSQIKALDKTIQSFV